MSLEPCQGMHLLSHCRGPAEVPGEPSSLSPKSALPYLHSQCCCPLYYRKYSFCKRAFSQWLSGKESACQCSRRGFDPWSGKIPWKRKRQPVFLLNHSSILAWKILWTKEPAGLQSMAPKDLVTEQQQQKGIYLYVRFSFKMFTLESSMKPLR